jgi:hypothetical protein
MLAVFGQHEITPDLIAACARFHCAGGLFR